MKSTIVVVTVLVLLPNLMGCSMLFRAAGAHADRHAQDEIPIRELGMVRPGSDIFLILDDSSTVEGRLSAVEKKGVWAGDSSEPCSQPITFVPASSGERRGGCLVGFDADTLWIRLDGNQTVAPFRLDETRVLTNRQGENIDRDGLTEIAPRLPFQYEKTAIVAVDSVVQSVPFSRIMFVRHDDDTWMEVKMLAAGICLDVAVLGIIDLLWHPSRH